MCKKDKKTFYRILVFIGVVVFFLTSVFAGTNKVSAAENEKKDESYTYNDARPSTDGQLSVNGMDIVNEKGEKVTIRGISTHGLTWYPDYINSKLFKQMSEEWGADFIRLPMYTEQYLKDKKKSLKMLHKGINAAKENDMYVLVDWHILNDNNPMINVEKAEKFFDDISKEYANDPSIIYEICNEPNGPTKWDDIYEYSNRIIPIIRANSPNALIVVGTPDYDQDLASPAEKRLDFENVMYSFHFYAASHYDDMMDTLEQSRKDGLPVFISECGITEADGNGRIDYENAETWFDYLHDNSISYVVWNLSNKNESSSFIKATSGEKKHLSDDDLTDSGKWIKALIQGENPEYITQGKTRIKYSLFDYFLIQLNALGNDETRSVRSWPFIALCFFAFYMLLALVILVIKKISSSKIKTYDDLVRVGDSAGAGDEKKLPTYLKRILICASIYVSSVYLCWRLLYSINKSAGWLPIVCNLLLLIVELFGFVESCIHYANMLGMKQHPLPVISDDEFPDVDIFIATYNEPEELLKRTINGCKHLKYPDKSKVHIWICDDNRRASMRKLAEEMGVGYFDRPDNKGAKAGNLNNALGKTSAPYVVTLDADMIVRSEFLLKTIPYFVYVEKLSAKLPEEKRKHLGLLQSPQCFYDPDVFQYALYSENNIPNEQDFFYRTIEVGKTSTNSVIYGGSNTVLSRRALEDIGGFYTETITEDFATGMLIESEGYLSLAIPEPLASGQTPHTFKEHIKQRTRWGRGVINTAKKLKIFRRKGLSLGQKLSYWSSKSYWYSPIKNLIYVLSPLFFAVFMIPVFRCNWLELVIFWLPMFILQDLSLRIVGGNKVSLKWSGIYELSVMPFLLIPVIKESLGISLAKFQVTDKSGKKAVKKEKNTKQMLPFIILFVLSIIGIIRVIAIFDIANAFGMVVILFWVLRNLYSIALVMFLINGRDDDSDTDSVIVKAGEMISLRRDDDSFEGISTRLTEHSVKLLIDDSEAVRVGDRVEMTISTDDYSVSVGGVVIQVTELRRSEHSVLSVEILDFGTEENKLEYFELLYDRIPTLPQSLQKDMGSGRLFWRNVIYRIMKRV